MQKLGKYLENFAFKSFDFRGRATRTEYWFVMFVVWSLLLIMIRNDLLMVWEILLKRRVPPLNPLAYASVVVFIVTMPARLSLNVRRLHDSGKSGIWAKLPYVCLWSGFIVSLGLGSALMVAGFQSGNGLAQGVLMGIVGMAFAIWSGQFWETIFPIVASLNALGWDGVMGTLTSIGSASQQMAGTIDTVGSSLGQSGSTLSTDPRLKFGGMVIVSMPFLTGLAHVVLMCLPSVRGDNIYGQPEELAATGALLMKNSDNPLAAYAHLYEKSDAQKQSDREKAKAEIKSLYKNRVLGKD